MLCLHLNILSSSFYHDDMKPFSSRSETRNSVDGDEERMEHCALHMWKLKQINIKYDYQIVFFNLFFTLSGKLYGTNSSNYLHTFGAVP